MQRMYFGNYLFRLCVMPFFTPTLFCKIQFLILTLLNLRSLQYLESKVKEIQWQRRSVTDEEKLKIEQWLTKLRLNQPPSDVTEVR